MSGTPDDGDWERVAATVRSRRIELGLSQAAAARRAKVGEKTWVEVERASGPKRSLTLAAISRFLWGPDHPEALERVAAGGRPPRIARATEPDTIDAVDAVRNAKDIPDEGKDAIVFLIESYRNRRKSG